MELLLPRRCAGCDAPGHSFCPACRRLWRQVPTPITTRVPVGAPVWALGPYGGPRRQAILSLKESGRTDLVPYLGAVLRAATEHLIARGELEPQVVLVAAPTTRRAARRRGGDPVLAVCQRSGFPAAQPVLLGPATAESVGLSAPERADNIGRNITIVKKRVEQLTRKPVLVVDDVVTTGATAAATVEALTSAKVVVRGVLGWSFA